MKGKISVKESTAVQKEVAKQSKMLPKDFEIVDILVKGRQVVVNLRELMELADCQNESIIKAAMNKSASYYFYFGRVEIELEEALSEAQEDFDIWLAQKTNALGNDDSEKAKERSVMTKYEKEYTTKKGRIRQISSFSRQASIARKALERNMSMLQSIGAFLRKEIDRPDSHLTGDESER